MRLLAFGFTGDEMEQITAFAGANGLPQAVAVYKEQETKLLQELVKAEPAEAGTQSSARVLIFCGVDQKAIHPAVSAFPREISPRPMFAMLTQHNARWNLSRLVKHLKMEMLQAQGRGRRS